MEITRHSPGSFCTAVLRTRDMGRAAAFYEGIIGWTTQPVSNDDKHRSLQFGGRTVASLHQIAEGPDLWIPHVSVQNVEQTITEALALGAVVVDTADIRGL